MPLLFMFSPICVMNRELQEVEPKNSYIMREKEKGKFKNTCIKIYTVLYTHTHICVYICLYIDIDILICMDGCVYICVYR